MMTRSELVKKVVAEGRERDRAIERDKLALFCKEIADEDDDLWNHYYQQWDGLRLETD